MEYMFDAFMFSDGRSSPCYVERQTAQLSKLDVEAVHRAYPAKVAERSQLEAAIRADTAGLARIAEPNSRFKESIANRRAYQRSEF